MLDLELQKLDPYITEIFSIEMSLVPKKMDRAC